MKKQWIYQIRGLAIIAVVTEHQMGSTHHSETIQLFTLFCVTTLVYLMGVTKALSLKERIQKDIFSDGILRYSIKSMLPVLCSFIVATFLYLCTCSGTGWIPGGTSPYSTVLTSALDFNASGPFYFIRYYILLSLWAPCLYAAIKRVLPPPERFFQGACLLLLLLIFIWIVGYWSIGKVDIFGESYLFVYSCGLLTGQLREYPHTHQRIWIMPASILLILGLISTKHFYWARIAGNYNYSGGVNFLAPKLQLNPPNISIILYSFGVISVAYFIFEACNNSKIKLLKGIGKVFAVLGKYSMDIFLYHLMILNYLNTRYTSLAQTPVLRWFIYQGCLFGIPILVRCLYNQLKSKAYRELRTC